MRVGLEDDLAPPPPPRPTGPPIHIAVTGFLSGLAAYHPAGPCAHPVGSWRGRSHPVRLALPGSGLGLRHLWRHPVLHWQVDQVPHARAHAWRLREHRLADRPAHLPGQLPASDQEVVVRHERPKDDPDALDEEDIEIKSDHGADRPGQDRHRIDRDRDLCLAFHLSDVAPRETTLRPPGRTQQRAPIL